MDASLIVMGLTLACAGVFLLRDYVQSLVCKHLVHANVVSIQQVFTPQLMAAGKPPNPYVADGFYPIIEYMSDGQPIRFTAIDAATSGRFHVGDRIKLKITQSRRKSSRSSRSLLVLLVLCLVLAGLMTFAAATDGLHMSIFKILGGSVVLAIGLTMMIIHTREQDERGLESLVDSGRAYAQFCLHEPTAFEKWRVAAADKRQQLKIRSAKAFAGCCFTAASMLFVVAFAPLMG